MLSLLLSLTGFCMDTAIDNGSRKTLLSRVAEQFLELVDEIGEP